MRLKAFIVGKAKWMAAFASCFTMVFSPLAVGKEAEKLSKANVEKYIVEFGLDQNTTLGEFWERTKAYYPGPVYKNLEVFIEQNRNMAMPEVAITLLKNTDGFEIPNLAFNQNGKIYNVQLFGEEQKWARFNGVNLSTRDLERPIDAFTRLERSDIRLFKEAESYRKNFETQQKNNSEQNQFKEYRRDFARFEGFPRMTPQLWQSMSVEDRAAFMVKMRLLWETSKLVKSESGPVEAAETLKKKDSRSSIENFYKAIFGESANAGPITSVAGAVVPSVQVKRTTVSIRNDKGEVVTIPYDAESCVVAGYVSGKYTGNINNVKGTNRAGCSSEVALVRYQNTESNISQSGAGTDEKAKDKYSFKFVKEANDFCAKKNKPASGKSPARNYIACNPLIYGFPGGSPDGYPAALAGRQNERDPVGSPACIDTMSAEFQYATHYSSPNAKETCDTKSRLSTDKLEDLKSPAYAKIQPRSEQLKVIEADQKKDDFNLTKKYLEGVLANRDPLLIALFNKGEWNVQLDNELVRIQSQFEAEINNAIQTCTAGIQKKHEPEQKLACDQLHRRWLFTERFIAKLRDKACVKPALYVGLYNKDGEQFVSSLDQAVEEKTKLNKKTIDEKGTSLCECPAAGEASPGVKVNFGQSCPAAATTAIAPDPDPAPNAKCAEGTTDELDGDGKVVACVCANNPNIKVKPGEVPKCDVTPAVKCDKTPGIIGFDYEACRCENDKKLEKNSDGQEECKSDNDILPWILGGLAILAVIALFMRNKNPKNPPIVPGVCPVPKTGTPPNCACPSNCANGSVQNPNTCACSVIVTPPSCPVPKVGTPPNCACPAAPSFCTPPQKIYDLNTCQCTDVPQVLICPNNQPAPNGNLALCPKCPNGSFMPATGCPTEGGGGNNCPQGGCSGGLPGAGTGK